MKKTAPFIFLILVLTLSACGSSGSGGSGSAVSSLEDAQSAVIQIESRGSFVDPEVGMVYNAGGRGSGFIIDPSGIAVTNNHVVTGAALIQVWVGGSDEPLNAQILGISECADLAVIDIEGDGFPYLEWYDGELSVGTDVYAAGFPLGDPEFTLTRGIIAKASANGESSWSSVDNVIMHDANINPGNSGGPLITADGQVVGVNYMGSQELDQFFAISRDEALRVIEILRSGEDHLSIGLNGQAILGENISGIWVSSVRSGSPADVAGIQGGDIVLTIEDLILATDGTMAAYCDILRTHSPGDVLDIQVLRYAEQRILEGQINGRELAGETALAQPTQPPAQAAPPTQAPAPTSPPSSGGSSGSTSGYASYNTVTDSRNVIRLEIPSVWTDGLTDLWQDSSGNTLGVKLIAAPDIDGIFDWTGPGIALFATRLVSEIGGPEAWADSSNATLNQECTFIERQDYTVNEWSGILDLYGDCSSTQALVFVFTGVTSRQSSPMMVMLQFQMLSERDVEAYSHAIASLTSIGPAP